MQAWRALSSSVFRLVLRGRKRRSRPMAFSKAPLPEAVGITEEGSHAEVLGQGEMLGVLGAVVEGIGSA